MSIGLVDHAKVHLRRADRGSDGESRVISAMTAYELIEVQIGDDVAVKKQERRVEPFAKKRQRSDRSKRLSSCVQVILMFH